MADRKERNFLDAFLTNVEVAVDLATDNQAVAAIPVIGTAVKICRGWDDLRSRVLAAKLAKFVFEPAMQTEAAKAKQRKKLADSPEEANKVGEALFLVLERVNDLDKPPMLAKIYIAYLDDVVSSADLRRLAQAIDSAFADDLQRLLVEHLERVAVGDPTEWKRPLVNSGLAEVSTRGPGPGIRLIYQTSPLGELFKRAMRHAEAPGSPQGPST